MEMVIPPRDHGSSTFRYAWDENGEVTQMTRVQEEYPPSTRRPIPGRSQTRWPFQQQSMASADASSSPTASRYHRRMGTSSTWRPWASRQTRDSDGQSVSHSLIPDYVVNYIRGETPETMARKKRIGYGKPQATPDIHPAHRHDQSRAGELDGFFDAASMAWGSNLEAQRSLTGGGMSGRGGIRGCLAGWRAGVAINTFLAFLMLIAGFVCLILAISRAPIMDGRSALFSGSCDTASKIDWGVHSAINIFALALIAGANYVFQVLSSPTRAEINEAHRKWTWLHIGIPSFRNLLHIDKGRVFLSLVLLLSAVIVQVIYNSVLLTTITAPPLTAALVTDSFLKGAPFSNGTDTNAAGLTRLEILALQASSSSLTNLTRTICLSHLSNPLSSPFEFLVLISSQPSPSPSSLMQTFISSPRLSPIPVSKSEITHCLGSGSSQPTCAISLAPTHLGAVSLLNSIAVVCTAFVLFKSASSFRPLATLGDAITSFLKEGPDPATQTTSCLLTKCDVVSGRWGQGTENKYWVPKDHYWIQSVSFSRWIVTAVVWGTCVAATAIGLVLDIYSTPEHKLSAFGSMQTGGGKKVVIDNVNDAAGTIIAALPQVLVGFLYLVVNGVLCQFWVAEESAEFAAVNGEPKVLRVSEGAEGWQRTSLYLTLPRPVSWGVMGLFAAMGFLTGQSLFVVAVKTTEGEMKTALGFSGLGLLTLLASLSLLGVLVLGLGMRKAPAAGLVNGDEVGNPMAMPSGVCSAVISARCHRLPGQQQVGMWKMPLVWGVVKEGIGMEPSHCSFTAGRAGIVEVGRNYA
ncbi:hypothetical protein QBC38DRAFT_267411 [Podospora fimiseda]|uniref:DUF6536 domain-containing protein n=1 Tax=Podospora fimiseda TaxID=252190 RepID=A0AAN7H0X2_9PEZI|nr:hypothetical protein QBC38DRAFT_267411 [Podospora fimiseda]